MIKTKNLLILGVVVVVLLGLSLLQKASHRRSTSQASTVVLIDGQYTADGLSRLTLGRGADEEAVDLLNGPEGWTLASAWHAKANLDRINALLATLSNLSGEYRSKSAGVLADYGLDTEGAVKIRAFGKDGAPIFALDVGNKPEGGAGHFVRLPEGDEVYLTAGGVLSLLGMYGEPELPRSRFFLDLQAIREEAKDIDSIRLVDAAGIREISKAFEEAATVVFPAAEAAAGTDAAAATNAGPDRSVWEWKLSGPKPKALSKSKVDAVLNALVSVRATDLDDPKADPDAYGLLAPSRVATLKRFDGSELVLEFGNDRPAAGDLPAGTWMRVQGHPAVWVVTEYTVKNVFVPVSDLLAD